jgi:hypothetical protein
MFASARIAVPELIVRRRGDPASDVTGQTAQQKGIGMGISERKGAARPLRDLELRWWRRRRACWQSSSDIGACAVSGLDKSVAEQMLISSHDGIAPDAKLLREGPTRRQFHLWSQEAVNNRGTQRRMHLLSMIADRSVQADRKVEYLPSPA